MSYPAASMTVIGVLSLINIVLTLGIIRRLGDRRWQPAGAAGADPPPITVRPGSRVGDFAVTAPDGTTVSRADLDGPTLIAFLAPGCQACDYSVPSFMELAEQAPGGRDHVLVVLIGSSSQAGELSGRLAPLARTLFEEEERGPLARAFGVIGLPAFALLSDGRLVGSASLPETLPDSAAA